MEIHFDGQTTEEFFQWMAAKIQDVTLPIVKETVEESLFDEELLTRKEISKRILNCSVDTADKYYLYQPGFPYLPTGLLNKMNTINAFKRTVCTMRY